MKVTSANETKEGLTIRVGYSLNYLDQFLNLKCAPDLVAMKMFPNVKEISESMSAFTAVRRYLKAKSFADRDITLVDVACGSTPRTASLFSFLTRWGVHAVDPNLKLKGRYDKIKRLSLHPVKIQDISFSHYEHIVVTMVHPHVKPTEVTQQVVAKNVTIVSIECCTLQETEEFPGYKTKYFCEYEDFACLSPKRKVRIWGLERVG